MRRIPRSLRTLGLLLLVGLTCSGCFLSGVLGRVIVSSIDEANDLIDVAIQGNASTGICEQGDDGFISCVYVLQGEVITSTEFLLQNFGAFGVFLDPVILQVPAGTTVTTATFDTIPPSTPQNFAVTAVASFFARPGVEVTPQPGQTFIILDFPGSPPAGAFTYDIQFQFTAAAASVTTSVAVKAVFAGKVEAGGQTFYPPILPCTTDFSAVPSVNVPVTTGALSQLTSQLFPLFQLNSGCDRVVFDFAEVAAADHYQCYKAKDSRGSICGADAPANAGAACEEEADCGGVEDDTAFCVPTSFPGGLRVSLSDQFETGAYDVKKPVGLCNPAVKNGAPINDEDTHLRGYQIKLAPDQPAHQKRSGLRILNQFHPSQGELVVATIKPDRLLVPTAKSLTQAVAPPDPTGHGVDHFKCYKVKPSPGAPKFQPIRNVTIADQFAQPRTVDVTKPTRLCTPADKNAEGIVDQARHLMCYQVKAVKDPPQPKHVKVPGIFVNNQFGPDRVDTIKEEEFCVPSQKIPPDPS